MAAGPKSRRQAKPPDPGRVAFPEGHQSHPEPPSAGYQSRQIVPFPLEVCAANDSQ